MQLCNLISIYQGAIALRQVKDAKEYSLLKECEIETLHEFCNVMTLAGCGIAEFDGYYVGYSINQISKEFDLLRFGSDCVINIELKSEEHLDDILEQMRINYYYLKFLGKPIKIFTYIKFGKIFQYNEAKNVLEESSFEAVADSIKKQNVDYLINPDKEFVPSNYLISPFNSTEKFMNDEYFLTDAQKNIKKDIKTTLEQEQYTCFCISANAGTGKTLLLYDIAKDVQKIKKVILFHCGKLNDGHRKLQENYGWIICGIKMLNIKALDRVLAGVSLILVDEAQRIRDYQLKALIEWSKQNQVSVIFSYDVKQYMHDTEGIDIARYLKENYSDIKTISKKLTTKIRTNKEIASFINNLLKIGYSKDNLNYENISIEYMDNPEELKAYIDFLKLSGWTPIKYTVSIYQTESFDELRSISDQNAHDVIGQEFSKVVFVMNENFRYDEHGLLIAGPSYYSAKGMLYQIVTRVVNQLKIIVYRNPEVYKKLLEIKAMEKTIS